MKKRLSTSMTFFYKFVFSAVWIVGFVPGVVGAIYSNVLEGLGFLIGFGIGTALIYYALLRAKVVEIDDSYLYVSNFKRKTKIPLQHIETISENELFSPRPIFIEFNVDTEFGRKIMFIGYTEFFLFFASHPAIEEIWKRQRAAKKSI